MEGRQNVWRKKERNSDAVQCSAVTFVRNLFPLNVVLSGDMFISFEREHRVWKYASTGNAIFGLNPETTDL